MNYLYYCHFPGLEFIQLLERVHGLFSRGQGNGWIFKIAYLLESDIGTDNSHVVISAVDALM